MSRSPDGAAGAWGRDEPGETSIVLAFAAIYLIWGSTYLAIRWAVETLPPLGMASVRFLLAGSMLYGWSRWRGAPPPTRRQWKDAAIAGTLLLAGGNGAVVVAEQWVPSGLAALLVASVSLWLVVLDALFGSKSRPSMRTVFGLLAGLAGVALLAGSPGLGAGGRQERVGAALLLFAAVAWAAGFTLFTVCFAASAPARPRGNADDHGGHRPRRDVVGLGRACRLRRRFGVHKILDGASIPDRRGGADRIRGLHLAAHGDHSGSGGDVRVRQSGRRDDAGVGVGGRARDSPVDRRGRHHPGICGGHHFGVWQPAAGARRQSRVEQRIAMTRRVRV